MGVEVVLILIEVVVEVLFVAHLNITSAYQLYMDEQVDLSKINCVPHHEMLAIVNQYIIGSLDHINK